MVQRRQQALQSGNHALYRFYHNRVNCACKWLRRSHYNQRVNSLCTNSGQLWEHIRQLAGLKQANDSMVCLANSMCGGNMQELANQINTLLQSMTADFTPLIVADDFTMGESRTCINQWSYYLCEWSPGQVVQGEHQEGNWTRQTYPTGSRGTVHHCGLGLVCAIYNSHLHDGHVPSVSKSTRICPLAKVNPPTVLQFWISGPIPDGGPGQDTRVLYMPMGNGRCFWGRKSTPISLSEGQLFHACPGWAGALLAPHAGCPRQCSVCTTVGLQQGFWQSGPLHSPSQAVCLWCA